MIGTTISHYEILEKLGEGGMGVVYKARDTKLDRFVALKFLSPNQEPAERDVLRFQHEAKTLSSLSHPNIATIFDLDHENAFIALEFLPHGTLKEKIQQLTASGQELPIDRVIQYGTQMALALAHAHRRGVVHRDIKSENMMLTEDDEIKVTDFGLAKLRGSAHMTNAGTVIGTAAYMSPEQARGEELDHRTDIFSLGVVLYEISTGNLPFRGEHPAAFMYSIIQEQPSPASEVRSGIPPRLERLILRCLEKDRVKRIQSADELVVELRTIQKESPGTFETVTAQRQVTFKQLTFADSVEEYPSLSPDGSCLLFSREIQGYKKLFIKNLSDTSEFQVTKDATDDIQPTWTSDGRKILFVRSHKPNGKLEPGDIFSYYEGGDVWIHDLDTGQDSKILIRAFNPSCSPDGKWIAVDASWAGPRRIWTVDNRGRNPRQITSDLSEAVVHINPKWSPDGTKIVFQNVERVKFNIRIVDVNSGKMEWVTDDMIQNVYPTWSPSGDRIFLSSFRTGGLNIWSMSASGRGNASSVHQFTMGSGQDIQVALSQNGKQLVYANVRLNADLWRVPVSPMTAIPTGPPEPLIVSTREESRGAWSPDGSMIAFNSDRSGDMSIWILTLANGVIQQVTHGAGGDFQPTWSPDGKSLVFFSARSGKPEIWMVNRVNGELNQLTKDATLNINPFFSPDGLFIAYHSDAAGRLEPWVMRNDGTEQRKLADMEVMGHFMRWSDDGKSVIFRSPNPSKPGLWSASIDNREPTFLCVPKGGAHISLSVDRRLILDVVDHKEIWITPLDGAEPKPVFKFDDPQVRIDYPVWSPDGKWILFDRVKPQGGNIWLMENIQ
jgi:Tol biopolymer transport system component/tRNA A-37 threonylcarbamoyl transferase component Bud32